MLAGHAKLAGILAEAAGDAVVVGVGLNVSTEPGELPPPGPGALAATSLRIAASAALESRPRPPRKARLARITPRPPRKSPARPPRNRRPSQGTAAHRDPGRLRALVPGLVPGRRRPRALRAAGRVHPLSGTIGRRVRAELPGGQVLSGLAVGVDLDGRLLVRVSSGAALPVAAGDVVHLR